MIFKSTFLWTVLVLNLSACHILSKDDKRNSKDEAGQENSPDPAEEENPTSTPPAEWSQHGHDAQRTSYTSQVVSEPWKFQWVWNAGDAEGKVSSGKFGLPRNVQPITGGGQVYIAAGEHGLYALKESDGSVAWNVKPGGNLNSTPAYDSVSKAVFVSASNGYLYKIKADDGTTLAEFNGNAESQLPLPPALIKDKVFFAMGAQLHSLATTDLTAHWSYEAEAEIQTPPSYSASRDIVILASADLKVHAVKGTDGKQLWRVRPAHESLAVSPPADARNFAEVSYGWPVIADHSGYVLIKYRLDWDTLWTWSPWPLSNAQIRQNLSEKPEEQALFVLDLDDGKQAFIANVGHGGYGDNNFMPMGPQPVVKQIGDEQDIVYTIVRGHPTNDGRWDSNFGEMILSAGSVSGYEPGDVRYISYNYPFNATPRYLLTDEQPNVSMAGNYLFGAHWEAGFSLKITDRSPAKGSFDSPISSENTPTVVTSQDDPGCAFKPQHYCAESLTNTRVYSPGFYIYYGEGSIYDQYWGSYAAWVVSGKYIYYRSTDGAIIALASGDPLAAKATLNPLQRIATKPKALPRPAEAWRKVALNYVFNNGKQLMMSEKNPHMGALKILIAKKDFSKFGVNGLKRFQVGQEVLVRGTRGWYQGDPVIRVDHPKQIKIMKRQNRLGMQSEKASQKMH